MCRSALTRLLSCRSKSVKQTGFITAATPLENKAEGRDVEMSVMVVWASPNVDGLTAAAKDRIVEGIVRAKGTAESLPLCRQKLQSCQACGDGWGLCKARGQCVLEDDFAEIYDRLVAADGIVFVTPVYWHDMAERLKCLLDRLRRCETAHNGWLKGKPCLLVACAGGTGNGAISCLNSLEETLGHMEMVCLDRLPVIRFNQEYMLPALVGAGEAFAKRVAGQQRK